MAKRSQLTTLSVQNAEPGTHSDGRGLYLRVSDSGAKRWFVRVVVSGRRSDVGLGSASLVSLADARDLAHEIKRKTRIEGVDPVSARRRIKGGAVPTFEEVAREVHKVNLPTWKNAKHGAQWLATLERHAFPRIGRMSVDRVMHGDVLAVLLPIWTTRPETARRTLQRLRMVFDFAIAAGHRSAANPVTLAKGGLPKQTEHVKHFAALPYANVPDFIAKLRDGPNFDAVRLALEFLILCASRSGEVRGAAWSEINLGKAVWTIPALRMKTGMTGKAPRPHTVPLSPQAVAVLDEAKDLWPRTSLIFPGRNGKMLSDMALTMALRRLGFDVTVHGFRTSFRTWAAECTSYPGELAEAALAHTTKSAVEAAYQRSDLLEKRRSLMNDWAVYTLGRLLP